MWYVLFFLTKNKNSKRLDNVPKIKWSLSSKNQDRVCLNWNPRTTLLLFSHDPLLYFSSNAHLPMKVLHNPHPTSSHVIVLYHTIHHTVTLYHATSHHTKQHTTSYHIIYHSTPHCHTTYHITNQITPLHAIWLHTVPHYPTHHITLPHHH